MIEIALLTLLKGTSAGKRIYPMSIPFKVKYPALTYQRIANSGHHDIDVSYPRIQYTAWSDELILARQLAGEVESRLRRYKGVIDGYRIKQIVKLPSPGDLFDREAGEAGIYYIPVDYRVIYEKELI